MAKNKDGGGRGGEGAVRGGARGQQPIITWFPDPAGPKRETHTEGQGERKRVREGKRGTEREREAGTAGEGGLPTSDPADGGHMAAASQIKRLRLGGSAITAV